MMTIVPPIKSQGIKTKLVPWINDIVYRSGLDLAHTNWIEPFFGTGVVGLNAPIGGSRYVADSNPHIINFYNGVLNGEITPQNMRTYLEYEGKILSEAGEEGSSMSLAKRSKSTSPCSLKRIERPRKKT